MNRAVAPAEVPVTSEMPRAGWVIPCLAGLAMLAIWGELLVKLLTDWATNQQYEFGPFVPLFILVLLALRWADRPPAVRLTRIAPLAVFGALLMLVILPIRVVQEANPDWRPLNWVHAAVVVALCLVGLAFIGGRPWVQHFGAPFLLIFFAVPWPLATEQGVIQFLTRHVTEGTAELLNGCGIPAFSRGNVIEVATGFVGVNQACSGIRSLAATLMSAAFFGEFYRLGWWRRGALIAGGVVTAFVLNLVRAFLLGLLQAEYGAETFQRWHDKTGLAIFAVSFCVLWAAASLLTRGGHSGETFPNRPAPSGWRKTFATIPAWAPVTALLWIAFAEFATESWYATRERGLPPVTEWTVQWPSNTYGFQPTEVPDEVKSILRYSEAATGILREPGKPTWQIYFLKWNPGRTSTQLAVMHRPEICLPATGMRHVSDGGIVTVQAHGLSLPFHGSVFDDNGRRLFVYRCLWEDRAVEGHMADRGLDISIEGRLRGAWEGRRNLGQKLLQVGIFDARDENEAREDLRQRLPAFVVPG